MTGLGDVALAAPQGTRFVSLNFTLVAVTGEVEEGAAAVGWSCRIRTQMQGIIAHF